MRPGSDVRRFDREYSRRQFGQAAAGIVLYFSMRPSAILGQTAAARLPADLEANRQLGSWLRINSEGTIDVFTALAQIAAEELDVAFERVRMRPVDTSHSPNESYTAGSASIEAGGSALRYAGANARAILLELAAARLGVSIDSLAVEDGVISSSAASGRVTYWQLASETSLARNAIIGVPLKSHSKYRIVGTSVPRLDIPAKLTGGEAYVQDMRLPGMLFGRVVRPPSYDAQLIAFNDTAVKGMPGVVTLIRDGRFLGVVARREEQALAARAALQRAATWTTRPELPDDAHIPDFLRASKDAQVTTVSSKSAGANTPKAVKTLIGNFSKPYLAHASIGPSCAL